LLEQTSDFFLPQEIAGSWNIGTNNIVYLPSPACQSSAREYLATYHGKLHFNPAAGAVNFNLPSRKPCGNLPAMLRIELQAGPQCFLASPG